MGYSSFSSISDHSSEHPADSLMKHHDYFYPKYGDNSFQPYTKIPLVNMTMPTTHLSYLQIKGLTGVIKFDAQGFRTDFELEITELDPKEGLKKV